MGDAQQIIKHIDKIIIHSCICAGEGKDAAGFFEIIQRFGGC